MSLSFKFQLLVVLLEVTSNNQLLEGGLEFRIYMSDILKDSWEWYKADLMILRMQ